MKNTKHIQEADIHVYLKNVLECSLIEEQDYLMSATRMEIIREWSEVDYERPLETRDYTKPTFSIEIENYRISDRFILIDLERPKRRVKKYRRCGFSTKKW